MNRLLVCALIALIIESNGAWAQVRGDEIRNVVKPVIEELMRQQDISGMAVAVIRPQGTSVLNLGVADREHGVVVGDETLFEIGSLSKLLTVSLATLAEVEGKLDLGAPASRYLPDLEDSAFDDITGENLATHTGGGLPLFVPDHVTDRESLIRWYQNWQPDEPVGKSRTYSNPGIGLLGLIAARTLESNFVPAMHARIFSPLDLSHTWYDVPEEKSQYYAMGEDRKGNPRRLTPGVLDDEAYGIKTTAGDLARFIEANLNLLSIDPDLQMALEVTLNGHYQVGEMTQALIWEKYPLPTPLNTLVAGNGYDMILEPNVAEAVEPGRQPGEAWLNKTGSTNGFGAYVVMIPGKQAGLVMLANKNYPNDARVQSAFQILSRLGLIEGENVLPSTP